MFHAATAGAFSPRFSDPVLDVQPFHCRPPSSACVHPIASERRPLLYAIVRLRPLYRKAENGYTLATLAMKWGLCHETKKATQLFAWL
jgi:hypothetical protein